MTQQEFDWSGSSLLKQIECMVCDDDERTILRSLIRRYLRLKSEDSDECEFVDGCILIVASKRQLANAIGKSERTIQRKLSELATLARYVRYGDGGSGRPHLFEIDTRAIMDAPRATHSRASDEDDVLEESSLLARRARLPQRGKMTALRGETKRQPVGDMSPPNRRQKGETCLGSDRDKGGRQSRRQTDSVLIHGNGNGINGSMGDGNSKNFSFGRLLQKSDFFEPERMQELYEIAWEGGIVNGSEVDRLKFFGLFIYVRRQKKITCKPKLLTSLVKGTNRSEFDQGPWRNRPTDADIEIAQELIHSLDYGDSIYERSDGYEPDLLDMPEESEAEDEPQPEIESEPAPRISETTAEQLRAAQARRKQELQTIGECQ